MTFSVTLAIDTGHARCQSAVLLADGAVLSAAENRARGHAEVLIGQIDGLLARAEIGYPGLQRVAVTTGPGSFTGLRVGLAAARGFGLALGVPVLGIPTLLALSLGGPPDVPLTVLADARRGEVWRQRFAAPAQPLSPPEAVPVDAALAAIRPGEAVVGSAAPVAAERAGAIDLEAGLDPAARGFVAIKALIVFAATLDAAGWPPDPAYLRSPDARSQAGARVARTQTGP